MSEKDNGALLAVSKLTKRYDGVVALNAVDFELEAGEIVGLIGPNGAGKTTLFNVISGFEGPDSGSVVFAGEDMARLTPNTRCARGIARTFQLTKPFRGMTVEENITSAALLRCTSVASAKRRAAELVEELGLRGYASHRAGQLSTGYQKRLELARALATSPRLLLLDEVFTGLSEQAIDEVIRIIQRVAAGGAAVVIVEHLTYPILRLASRVVALDHGEQVAEGAPSRVVKSGGVTTNTEENCHASS
jgi:branched-chain amino acid transport system ATP-binding protein